MKDNVNMKNDANIKDYEILKKLCEDDDDMDIVNPPEGMILFRVYTNNSSFHSLNLNETRVHINIHNREDGEPTMLYENKLFCLDAFIKALFFEYKQWEIINQDKNKIKEFLEVSKETLDQLFKNYGIKTYKAN